MEKRTINTQHPVWGALISEDNHRIFGNLADVPNSDTRAYLEGEMDGYDFDFSGTKFHIFKDPKHGFDWAVFELASGQWLSGIMGMMGGVLEEFPSLKEALEASYCDWAPESYDGDYDDDLTQYVLDGQLLFSIEEV